MQEEDVVDVRKGTEHVLEYPLDQSDFLLLAQVVELLGFFILIINNLFKLIGKPM